MMEERQRKPGSVRLTDEQYQEMEQLGLENESAYVKYKLNGAQQHLQVLRSEEPLKDAQTNRSSDQEIQTLERLADHPISKSNLHDRLALQRLSLENEQLKTKLDELTQSKDQVLDGIHGQVSTMLQDELLKRDFEQSKKDLARLEKEIERLEKELEKSGNEIEEKESEIEELVKKLGLVELGKALLPGAVSGLAKKYPKEMQGLAATLGELSGEEQNMLPSASLSEEQQNLLNIAEYFRELFDDEQFEQVVQLISMMGEQVTEDETLIGKVVYYLNQLAKVRKSQQKQNEKQVEPNEA
ncbi:MAG: hypothetical protein AAGA02_00135 [Bacteroidota bacterium]